MGTVQMSVEKAESIRSSLPANDKLMVTGYKFNDPVTDTVMLQDNAGFIIRDYSLSILMGSCTDFANEKSQLEYVCQSLGVEA